MEAEFPMKNTAERRDSCKNGQPNTYAEALRAAVAHIKTRRAARGFDLARRYILFVPDKYTLLAEKLLYGDGCGSFDTEVLTINRLCFRLAEHEGKGEAAKPLSRLGAILTVRKILEECKGELACFCKSAEFPGFGETLYDNICQLASSGLRAEDLPDDAPGIAGYKMRDVKRVYAAYERETNGKYVDATGRLLLTERMLAEGTDYFAGAETYFACYDGFTPLTERIVRRICACSAYAEVVDATCELRIQGSVEEYAAPSRTDEFKAAAVRIRNLALSGERYGDMGVIASGADYNRLSRIFEEYDIPFFTDVKYSLGSHPLARYLSDLFAAAQSGTNENYVRLSKNPYAGVEPADADLFENYLLFCAVPEGGLRNLFTIEPNDVALADSLPVAEEVRRKLTARVAAVQKSGRLTGERFCRLIADAFPADEADISARYNGNFPSAREEIQSAAAVLGEVFPSPVRWETLSDALKECFALKEVSVLPNLSDTVEVGEVSVFRASGKKYLFVLGMHEGELPAVMRDDGILSDRDIEAIAAAGEKKARIEPSIDTLNRRAVAELYSVLSASEHLFLSYCVDMTPSPVLQRIRADGRVHRHADSTEYEREELREEGRTRTGCNALLRLCPTRKAATELYLIGKCERDAGGDGLGFEAELAAALEGGVPAAAEPVTMLSASRELYRRKLSVSRVQEYFACPFRCFLRYGLRLGQRPDGEVSPLDLGTFLHKIIELYVRDGEFSDPQTRVPQLVRYVCETFPQMLRGASEDFIGELTQEATGLCAVVADQIARGDFAAQYTEASFGRDGDALRGREVALRDGTVTVEGVIDRLDVANGELPCDGTVGGRRAARIIDYKTGHAEFALSDIYYGRKIQLPVYGLVARENGFTPVGMFYFPFSAGFSAERNGYRLMGLFDERYADKMDGGLCEPGYVSDIVAARSAKASSSERVVLYKGGAGVPAETLTAVCDYAEEVMRKGAEEMLGGYCAAAPLSSGQISECTYCEMQPVCRVQGGKVRERRKSAVKADFIAASLAAERGEKHE